MTIEPVAAAPADADRRLHPMSWLFVLVAQLRQFIVPLVALLVFGQSRDDGFGGQEWWPLIGVAALVIASLWRYFTYRYGLAEQALVVRSGLFERSVRVVPFARIHNVALQQSMLHRLFGVAEVRLESAGGQKPEAEMRVLKLADALALEALIRRRAAGSADPVAGDAGVEAPAATPLLALSIGEVLRLGLVSNRGLILLAAGFGGLSQFSPRLIPNLAEQVGGWLFGWAGERHFGPAEYALAALALFALAMLALRLLSVLLSVMQYYGFRLSEHERRLTVERGLLARWRTSASRRRIQAWTLREGLLHRWLGRRSLEVDTAVAEQQGQPQRTLRELAPIAPPQACEALIEHLLPRAGWSRLEWRALPLARGWRLWWPDALFTTAAAAVLSWRFGPWAALLLLWLPWSAWRAQRCATRLGYACNGELVAVREGWWWRHWRFAEIEKLQALRISRSPLDRRCGTATLSLDTAGAGAMAPPLRIRFLAEDEARALYDELARELAQRPLRW
ncbi:MAG TPA: PH domain-containing protein [Rhodanobacteraceae bacterium]|nr:PH domain-containing protein [Rhodanobacteraceae bacterium]